jgi:uncharacterized protein YkwD
MKNNPNKRTLARNIVIYFVFFLITIFGTATLARHHATQSEQETTSLIIPAETSQITQTTTQPSETTVPLQINSPLPSASLAPPITPLATPRSSPRLTPSPTITPATKRPQSCGTITVEGIIELTNDYRRQNGLSELKINEQLNQAMQLSAQFAFEQGSINHGSPEGPGTSLRYFSKQTHYLSTVRGENQLYGACSNQESLTMWLNSPNHKANIMDSQATEMGVGIVIAPYTKENIAQGTIILSEIFGE